MNLLFKCFKYEYGKKEKEKKVKKLKVMRINKKSSFLFMELWKTPFLFEIKKSKEKRICELFGSIKLNFKTKYGFSL